MVATWRDVATRDVDAILSTSVGALLIFIPSDLEALSPQDKQLFIDMEKRFLNEKTDLTVYVSPSTSNVRGLTVVVVVCVRGLLYLLQVPSILSDIESTGDSTATATAQLLHSLTANTFQFTSVDSQPADVLNYKPNNIIVSSLFVFFFKQKFLSRLVSAVESVPPPRSRSWLTTTVTLLFR